MSNARETEGYLANARVQEELTAMLLELRSNRVILAELMLGYRLFRFTGSEVPRQAWGLVAMTTYARHPFAADRVLTTAVQRYCTLAEEIMALGHSVAVGRPRTLRSRWDIAQTFVEKAQETQEIASDFEVAFTTLFDELAVTPNFAARMHAFGAGEEELVPLAVATDGLVVSTPRRPLEKSRSPNPGRVSRDLGGES